MNGVQINTNIINGYKPSSNISCLKYTDSPKGIVMALNDIDDMSNMKKADTIHDFWNLLRGEDVQDILNYMINAKGESANMQKHINVEIFKTSGTIINDIEPKANSYFESRYETLPSLCRSNKYGDVEVSLQSLVSEYKNKGTANTGPIWNNILNNPMINAIRISVPQHVEKKNYYEDPDNAAGLNYASNFIMTFCGRPDNTTPVVFPIDATAGQLPKIFRGINGGVYTLATAMTVADSAGGGLDEKSDKQKRLIHFNKKYEPFYFPFTNNDKYFVNSEYFTQGKLKMYYKWPTENGVFSSKNQLGIKFGIVLSSNNFKEIEFGTNLTGSPVSGASVATLRSLMHIIYSNLVKSKNAQNAKQALDKFKSDGGFDKQLDLTDIVKFLIDNFTNEPWVIIGFLCDYKRAGDYEQVLSTSLIREQGGVHPIFCTGDELCALFSRTQGLNTVWSHGIYMDLFRFKTGEVNQAAIQRAELQRQYNALNEVLKDFENVIDNPLYKNYIEALDRLLQYYQNYSHIHIAIYGLSARLNNTNEIYDSITSKMENINLAAINNNSLSPDDIPKLQEFFNSIDKFSQVFSDIKRISSFITKYPGEDINGVISKNLPGPVTLSPAAKPLIPAKYIQSELFNYSLEDANKFYNLKEKIIRYNEAKPRQKSHMEESIKEIIEEYKSTVMNILNTFKYDVNIAQNESIDTIIDTIIENLAKMTIDPDTKNIKIEVVEKMDTGESNDNKISILQEFKKDIINLSSMPTGGRSQKGGAIVRYDTIDPILKKYFNDELLTLFVNISDECLNLLESIYSHIYSNKYDNYIKNLSSNKQSGENSSRKRRTETDDEESGKRAKSENTSSDLQKFLTVINDTIIDDKYKTICTKFNIGLNDILDDINIKIGKDTDNELDVSSLPISIYMLIVILNSNNFETYKDTTFLFRTDDFKQDARYTYFIEYNKKYNDVIIPPLNNEITSGNVNSELFKLISHIKTLYLLNRKKEIQLMTLLFFAISKKYILNSDYVMSNMKLRDIFYNDNISKTSLDYFTLPSEANLLIIQNLNFKQSPSDYFYYLINSIMVSFFFTQNPTQSPPTQNTRKRSRGGRLRTHKDNKKKSTNKKRKTRKNELSK